jgi:hypothetical protein
MALIIDGTTGITAPQFTSSATTGTAPFVVSSTTQVANLNAATAGTASAVSSGVVTGKMIYDTFTATASQTSFTTSQTYTSGKIEVFVNGCKFRNGTDVTVTSGTAVVMATGLTSNDLVDLVYPI